MVVGGFSPVAVISRVFLPCDFEFCLLGFPLILLPWSCMKTSTLCLSSDQLDHYSVVNGHMFMGSVLAERWCDPRGSLELVMCG